MKVLASRHVSASRDRTRRCRRGSATNPQTGPDRAQGNLVPSGRCRETLSRCHTTALTPTGWAGELASHQPLCHLRDMAARKKRSPQLPMPAGL